MKTRMIGSLEVSAVGLGCNNFGARIDEDKSLEVVAAALDCGITFFDTADFYGPSERWLGKALAGRRDSAVIATKFGMPLKKGAPAGASPNYVAASVERSLDRLQTDYIDLFQLHVPDPSTPIEDTLGALAGLIQEGKVREVGCSKFSPSQLDEAEKAAASAGARFVSVQAELNLLDHRTGTSVLRHCEDLDLSFLPYYPLANGMLTGKYRRDVPPVANSRLGAWSSRLSHLLSESNFAMIETLDSWATERGHTLLELAFAWLAAKPRVGSVIAGATGPEQVILNSAAINWEMSEVEVKEVDEIVGVDR